MSKNEFATQYVCVCNQTYSTKSELRKHVGFCKHAQNQANQYITCPTKKDVLKLAISECEIQSINGDQTISKDQKIERFKCGCEKRFMSKGGYYRHIKKCNLRPEQQIVTGKTKCNEPGCLLTFKYIRDFRQHLNEKHCMQFDVEDKKFNRYSEFICWKENYETETRSCFYHRKTETRSGRRVEYWYCNRSGIYQSASQGRRRKLKSQGILKINNNCTSSITLTINEIEGTVQAIIYHTHYGHEAELVHLRIPKSDKQEIASKLLQGVKIEDILLSYKEDGSSKQIERKHLIKRRDILNISKKYNVNIILPTVRQSSNKKKNSKISHQITKSSIEEPSLNTNETKKKHVIASQLPLSFVLPIYENVWKISMSNNSISSYSNNCNIDFYVTKINVKCCDDCIAFCNFCNICYHSYSCTCSDYFSNKIICEHVHLVILFQGTPQTYQYTENVERPHYTNHDHSTYTRRFTESVCSDTEPTESNYVNEDLPKNNDYNLYNKQNFKLENLKRTLEKLMMETLQKVNECNNYNLLENIKKQMTDITCNLNTDLLHNKEKSNEVQTIINPEKNIEVFYDF
ncbi:uncharacterized protein LOC112683653 isoform X1 [Sipha flava]|uniref:Uncharacterized protein LOC112683653 isoform X1 n=1 Tax=Sipha flava TaxID=143950 RepID=A0A8B8FJ96_9HEMI|nr:uncharacterized protein LOC112683653 isoform X1 [Sipha flava]